MLRATTLLMALSTFAIGLGGCGSGEGPLVPTPSPLPDPPVGGDTVTHEVGPLVIRTASAAGFVAEDIPADGQTSLVALYGSTIQNLASQAMLDRILFISDRDGEGHADIWVCDLDGSNAVQLTANNANEGSPCWSPDGTQIAFDRQWPFQDYEIVLMNADGSGIQALTNNTSHDEHPTFGPGSRRIAFAAGRDGNYEIYTMFRDGTSQVNISNNSAYDLSPDWSRRFTDPTILFCSRRDATTYEIYEMNPDGSDVNRRTTTPEDEFFPAYDPTGSQMTYQYVVDVYVRGISSGTAYNFSASPATQARPSWSSDGRFICYASSASGDHDLVLQKADEPTKFALTHNLRLDSHPDLGSPTLQTDRVLIGPAGSDWGGADPIWTSAYAAIAAFSNDGYENLVRIGIRPADVGTLEISPLSRPAVAGPGVGPVGVVVEAGKIVNLREDAGRGVEPIVWDLDALNLTAALLYFSSDSGKLISVLALDDAVYPSAAGAPMVTEQASRSGLVVTGSFAAVFDASGRRAAGPSSQVTFGADGPIGAH